jgi:N-methylhydantoinase A
MREVLRREHPAAVVSISSEVLREYREYERAVTTLVDAAVKPRMASYVANIAGRLRDLAQPGDERVPFYVMKSNGGVLSAEEVVHQPITTVLSGPAAGALGAALVAREAGFDRLLTCDGGGTSTDVSVVLAGEPTLTTEGTVGSYPSKIPMIDVVTVGAGGGSVAWVTPEGSLKVGPRSAGADPGPLCYGRGGTEPTVTDAHVLLGRIPPHLLGRRDPARRRSGPGRLERWAPGSGSRWSRPRPGILEISAWNQANALREVTVKRGLDVRDFTMATFGGVRVAAAVPAARRARLAGVLCRATPGNLSAFGLLTVDVRNDYVRTAVSRTATSTTAWCGGARRPAGPGRGRAGPRGLRPGRAPLPPERGPAVRGTGLRGARPRARRCGGRPAGPEGRRRLPRRARAAVRLRVPRRPSPAGGVGEPAGHRRRADRTAAAA